MPGSSAAMDPQPDYGEASYKGSGRLAGKKTVITGGDSGIGRAVALAFAREGADVLVSYYDEHEDAKETQRLVESAGRQCVLMPGDIKDPAHCRAIVGQAVSAFGRIDVLVNNAAHQASFASIEDIGDEEWDVTFRTNVHAMFYLTKAAVPHMQAGGSIINTASINADTPSPNLLAYATTKGAIQNFSAGLAQLLAERGITGELRRAGADLDAVDSVDNAGRQGQQFWQAGSDAAPRSAQGGCAGLCPARRRRGQLHVGRDDRGDRR